MSLITAFLTATFTAPERIGANPQSMLWLLPLVAAIVTVYKSTKMPKIEAGTFLKEVVVLSGSIIVFMTVIALVLCALAWLVIE